jgi:hypothetical protein
VETLHRSLLNRGRDQAQSKVVADGPVSHFTSNRRMADHVCVAAFGEERRGVGLSEDGRDRLN